MPLGRSSGITSLSKIPFKNRPPCPDLGHCCRLASAPLSPTGAAERGEKQHSRTSAARRRVRRRSDNGHAPWFAICQLTLVRNTSGKLGKLMKQDY